MAKIRTSFALSADELNLLKQLAELKQRSQADTLGQLIKEAAKKEKIKPQQP